MPDAPLSAARRLAELEARATKAKWHVQHRKEDGRVFIWCERRHPRLAEIHDAELLGIDDALADAAYIAACRNANIAAQLVSALEDCERLRQELRSAVNQLAALEVKHRVLHGREIEKS